MYTITAIMVGCIIVFPLYNEEKSPLLQSTSIKNPETLGQYRNMVIRRYVKDEQAFLNGHITQSEWEGRKKFLQSLFIDLSKGQRIFSEEKEGAAS